MKRILVACEFSGVVRDAFSSVGWDAWSCDLLDTERHGKHYKTDVRDIILSKTAGPWDMMIAHPPCTHLAVSGARWFKEKTAEQEDAIKFFMQLANAPIQRIAIENPVCIMSRKWRKPDQIIQPWQFGHGETKATCLWLKNLPPLQPTHRKNDMFCKPEPKEREQRIWKLPPGPNRWKERSRTFQGIAEAMADQWGCL